MSNTDWSAPYLAPMRADGTREPKRAETLANRRAERAESDRADLLDYANWARDAAARYNAATAAPTTTVATTRTRARGTLAKLPARTTYDLACWDAVDADDLPAFVASSMPTDDAMSTDGAGR